MSWALFKANIRDNRTLWIIMTAVFSMYMVMIMAMFDPNAASQFAGMLDTLPEAMRNAFGFDRIGQSLISFVAASLYGFLVFLFPMVISVVVNHKLIAAPVDKGSMAYLLATPNTRKKIALTQVAFSLVHITLLFVTVTAVGILFSQAMFPGHLNIGQFIMVNVYALILYYALGGIGFLASCMATESKHSLSFGLGLPVTFLILQLLGNAGDKFSWVGKLSLYYLFDPIRLLNGDSFAYLGMAVFAVLALALYTAGVTHFDRRDLHV